MITLCIKDNNTSVLNNLYQLLYDSNYTNMSFRKHTFKLYKNIIIHYTGNDINNFYNFISQMLCICIIKVYEPLMLEKIFKANYFYFDKNDKKLIFNEYDYISEHNNNKSLIIFPLLDYIKNNQYIYLEGFVNFRLSNYVTSIQNQLDQAINNYVVNKEYNRFVDMLRNYVLSKPSESTIVNLIYVNSEGFLLDENENFIDLKTFNSPYLTDVSFSNNDFILNTLIGLLPKQIILHLISKKDDFINTLFNIFENKITLCNNCNLCKTYKLLE